MDEFDNLAISEEELDEANDKLCLGGSTPRDQRLDPDKLYKIAMEIYHQPSKYIDIIRKFMKTIL
jgi:hypothetical protein